MQVTCRRLPGGALDQSILLVIEDESCTGLLIGRDARISAWLKGWTSTQAE
jgi:hypothetical protein